MMENKELCKECKGQCCKNMGCHFSPDQFNDLSFEGLKKEIDKGFISIDWWEGNPFDEEDVTIGKRGYFLRVRNKNKGVIDPAFYGECSLLTEDGCSLSYDERPKGGRELIPTKENGQFKCELKYTKNECARDWYKYSDVLDKLYEYYYEDNNSEDLAVEYDFIKRIMELMNN